MKLKERARIVGIPYFDEHPWDATEGYLYLNTKDSYLYVLANNDWHRVQKGDDALYFFEFVEVEDHDNRWEKVGEEL